MIVTLIAGGKMVLDGQVSIGQFVAFNSYIDMLVWPMIAAGDCINTFSQAVAAWGRIKTIFEEKPDIVDMVPENPDLGISGDIKLDHLTFTYPDGTKTCSPGCKYPYKKG